MRFGWIISALVHAGAVLALLVEWPMAAASESVPVTVVPVEIMTLADVSNVRAIAPPQPEEAAPVEETAPDEPAPAPEAAPVPVPARERQRSNNLDLADLQQDLMRDIRRQKSAPRRVDGAPGEAVRERAGLGSAEAAALRDRLAALTRAHMQRNRCWRSPVDMPNPERLVVQVRFRLDARGRVSGRPEIVSPRSTTGNPELRVAVDRAVRAVLQCDPYPFPDDPLAAEHYEIWREMEFNFDPREMSG